MNDFDHALKIILNLRGENFMVQHGGKEFPLKGIFSRKTKIKDTEAGAEILLEDQPGVKISLSSLSFLPAQKDRIFREKTGESFAIDQIIRDSHNGAVLVLTGYGHA